MVRAMSAHASTFSDPVFISLVKDELPKLFKEARREADALGNPMTVGLYRKNKIINLLIRCYGHNRIEDVSSSRVSGRDVLIDNIAISIKTISNNNDVKLKWTVDAEKVAVLMREYIPLYDLILARINWDMREKYQPSGLFFIPKDTQINILQTLGRENYIRPPSPGVNARGSSLTKQAFEKLLDDNDTIHIDVDWTNY